MEIEWIGYELHPETPAEGVKITTAFPDLDAAKMITRLNEAGAPYGVKFSKMEIVSNTRIALEASEFARKHNRFNELHDLLFEAYFVKGQNIGQLTTVLAAADKAGLDAAALEQSLKNKEYAPHIEAARKKGQQYQVAGLPTFIINEKKKIVGAQPYQTFTAAIESFL